LVKPKQLLPLQAKSSGKITNSAELPEISFFLTIHLYKTTSAKFMVRAILLDFYQKIVRIFPVNIRSKYIILQFLGGLFIFLTLGLSAAVAAMPDIPTSAEVDRFKPKENQPAPNYKRGEYLVPKTDLPLTDAPAAAKSIKLLLKDVDVKDVTVFTAEELKPIYEKYLSHKVSLEVAWIIAAEITNKYRDNGYFLSRAYVPEQEIDKGVIRINVVEGYVGKVEIDKKYQESSIIQQLINDITSQKPVKAAQLESFLLRLNDLPSYSFRGVLSDLDSADESAVLIKLVVTDKENAGSISLDNFGSRYLGPQQVTLAYQANLLPMQQTNFATVAGTQIDELKFGSLEHIIMLNPKLKLQLNATRTEAAPGYTLGDFNIKSRATSYSTDLSYQWVRQRLENLVLKFSLEARNTNTALLGNQITHDHIRAFRANAYYDIFDNWNGYNAANITFSNGLDILDASQSGDVNLSHEQAKPNFRKVSVFLSRQQALTEELSLTTALSTQYASGTLYSSESFGYGGQGFGRAYDSSDITGDHGIAGSAEIRYNSFNYGDQLYLSPYIFYDVGKIWNINVGTGEKKELSGSSAGFGVRFDTIENISGLLGLSFPLTKDVSTPIYDSDNSNTRINFQVTKSF